ncbi:MAG TPA: hypothetical protein VHN12_05770 [Geobacteraceae bacterium]|nr:hypothetical protein [Geobacteraceae bacterium]
MKRRELIIDSRSYQRDNPAGKQAGNLKSGMAKATHGDVAFAIPVSF